VEAVPPPSLDQGHFRLFLAPLLFIHLLNLLFDYANGLVQPVRVLAHALDFNGRKPFAGILRRLAKRLEVSGTHCGVFSRSNNGGKWKLSGSRGGFDAGGSTGLTAGARRTAPEGGRGPQAF
jgi:hypothetical protein